jgi:hypothetical protein
MFLHHLQQLLLSRLILLRRRWDIRLMGIDAMMGDKIEEIWGDVWGGWDSLRASGRRKYVGRWRRYGGRMDRFQESAKANHWVGWREVVLLSRIIF